MNYVVAVLNLGRRTDEPKTLLITSGIGAEFNEVVRGDSEC